MVKIILDGRTDIDDYFEKSGVLFYERLNHTPLLVFVASEESVRVRIVDRPAELLSLPDETQVMGQWEGQWRSDFFQFTVGDYRRHLEAKYEPFKSARNVVKCIGPQGGFRSLSFEYTNESGVTVQTGACSREEAERLEAFFARHGIPVSIQRLDRSGLR